MKQILLILLFISPIISTAQFITTVAGTGTPGNTGDGGAATSAQIGYARGIKADDKGNIYIVFQVGGTIRKVASTGIITTFAGNGLSGDGGDLGPATSAQLQAPTDISFDKNGNAYIADAGGKKIRKVNSLGIISTFAGNGISGNGGDGGQATSAQFKYPNGIVFDNVGNAYVTDEYNNNIRKITPAGIISTFAGNGTASYSGDGGTASSAALNGPSRITIDPSGNLYIDDYGNNRIRKVNNSGNISLVAGNGAMGFGGDGTQATAAQLSQPVGIDIDGSGNIYIADNGNNRIRKINPAGIISTIAGTGIIGYNGDCILATAAELNSPIGVTISNNGYIYIAEDGDSRVRVISPSCKLSVNNIEALTTDVTVYPNPVQNILCITTTEKMMRLSIDNILGRQLFYCSPNSEDVQIDVADLPAGMYFIKINGIETRRFVKQ